MRALRYLPQGNPLHDAPAYIVTYGHDDKKHLLSALRARGQNTAIRVGFNVTGHEIPYRMLGLFAAAYYTTNMYFPEARLEMVATAYANEYTNGIAAGTSIEAATHLFNHVVAEPNLRTVQPKNLTFATDKPFQQEQIDHKAVREAVQAKPEMEQLRISAKHRDADYASYVAAHLLIHDTSDSTQPLEIAGHTNAPLKEPEYLIAFGGKLETGFYNARMHCHQAGVEVPGRVLKTGQLITKQVLAPYIFSRKNPSIDIPIADRASATQLFMSGKPPAGSIARDIMYADMFMAEVEIARECLELSGAQSICKAVQVTANDAGYWNSIMYGRSQMVPAANGLYLT